MPADESSINSPPARWSNSRDSSGNQSDLALDRQAFLGHGQSQQADGARGGRRQTHQHLDGGGFAGSVGSQEFHETAARHAERQPVHGGFLIVHFPEIVDLDRWRNARRRRVPREVRHAFPIW